jgi:hypothetical protein
MINENESNTTVTVKINEIPIDDKQEQEKQQHIDDMASKTPDISSSIIKLATCEKKVEPIEVNDQNSRDKSKRIRRKQHDLSTSLDMSVDKTRHINDHEQRQPLFEQPIILEGKRSRKPTTRLELTELTLVKQELAICQVNLDSRVVGLCIDRLNGCLMS